MAVHGVQVAQPIRRPRSKLVQKDGLEQAVALARIQTGCEAIVVLLDAHEDCPKKPAPDLQRWAVQVANPLPCSVVFAKKEYEGWFLSCVESLRGQRGISASAISEPQPEEVRDAKGRLESKMEAGRKYVATSDQVALTAVADWATVHTKCRSFRKFAKETKRLLQACNTRPQDWP